MNAARRLLCIVLSPWVLALAGVLLARACVGPDGLDCECTTDTDCMQRCGGDGDPEPATLYRT